jgi:hypothetical protein
MVRVSDVYLLSYCILYVLVSFMYIFVHVPVAGRIAPASDRNRIGPLLTRSASLRALSSLSILRIEDYKKFVYFCPPLIINRVFLAILKTNESF